MQTETATAWPMSETELFTMPPYSHKQFLSTAYPGTKRATINQLRLSTRARRSPFETVMNEQVNHARMIPNNYTSTSAHSASYYQIDSLTGRLIDPDYTF